MRGCGHEKRIKINLTVVWQHSQQNEGDGITGKSPVCQFGQLATLVSHALSLSLCTLSILILAMPSEFMSKVLCAT